MALSNQYDVIIAIGAIIRGATGHYDAVVSAATAGCLGASTETGIPIIFGVLTCDTMEQALDRAGGKAGNKGHEFAISAVEMANLLQNIKGKSSGEKLEGESSIVEEFEGEEEGEEEE